MIRRLFPSSNPSLYSSIEYSESHFLYTPPPPLSDDLQILFLAFTETFSDVPINTDEISAAFKSASKSAPGSDGLLYSD